MSEKLLKSLKNEINAALNWLRQGKNLLRLFIMAAVLTALAVCAVLVNRPAEGELPTSASQMVFERAVVTAVLSDDAAPDYEYAEGKRVGTQELEIRVQTGIHKNEIMSLTNYMSAMFNVDLEKDDSMRDAPGAVLRGCAQYPELTKVWSFIKNLHSLYLRMIDRKQKSVINLIYYKLSASEKKSFLR